MQKITTHEGFVFPLNRSDVDTDQIIPKQFLKRVERTGFGQFLFYNWRFDEQEQKLTDFPLNDLCFKDASILVAGDNFGCGSSREHAPWALLDYGFRVIIAPSFADIFYNNALKNGLLLIRMDETNVEKLQTVAESGKLELLVDLTRQYVENKQDGTSISFDIPSNHKEKLLHGLDDIALTMKLENYITKYERQFQKA